MKTNKAFVWNTSFTQTKLYFFHQVFCLFWKSQQKLLFKFKNLNSTQTELIYQTPPKSKALSHLGKITPTQKQRSAHRGRKWWLLVPLSLAIVGRNDDFYPLWLPFQQIYLELEIIFYFEFFFSKFSFMSRFLFFKILKFEEEKHPRANRVACLHLAFLSLKERRDLTSHSVKKPSIPWDNNPLSHSVGNYK